MTRTRARSPLAAWSQWDFNAQFDLIVAQQLAKPRRFTFVDLFCGAGGSSIGLAMAGGQLLLGANHNQVAIETHAHNFPDAEHLCADINHYDMRRLPRGADVLWASPICTEISPAGGRARKADDTAQRRTLLEEGPIAADTYERTRATAQDVIRAAEVHQFKLVLVENVVEFATDWKLFQWWLQGMELLGYNAQVVSVSSAHVGGEDNPAAPQYRDRIYVVFSRKDLPIPDMRLRPLAFCSFCDTDVQGVQAWKETMGAKFRFGPHRVGKYREQYVYRCPNSACQHSIVEPYVRPAKQAIDWSDLGQLIGDRKRPLAASTRARIGHGIQVFACPTVVNTNHDDNRAFPADGAPFPARTTKIGDGIACPPFFDANGGSWNTGPAGVDVPMRARTTRDWEALVVPPGAFIDTQRNHGKASSPDEPLTTIAASGNHHGIVAPDGAFLVKNYGGHAEPRHMVKPVDGPFGTVTAKDHHGLVIPYNRTGVPFSTDEPFKTMTVKDRFGLIAVTDEDIDNCTYRMVQPKEQKRSQRIHDSYLIKGNKGQQTAQAGNAVSANVAQWASQAATAVLR